MNPFSCPSPIQKKGPHENPRSPFAYQFKSYLNFTHTTRLGALLALGDLKAHPAALFERFKTIALDFGMMNEDIRSIHLLDKTKTLCVIKPLHCSFYHFVLHAP